MREITKEDFDKVVLPPKSSVETKAVSAFQSVTQITPEELEELERQASVPVNLQKSLVAKLSAYVDYCFERDLKTQGGLTDHTRRFVELYNNILANLHKEMYGEKQVTMGSMKVTHSIIAKEIRNSSRIVDASFKEVEH